MRFEIRGPMPKHLSLTLRAAATLSVGAAIAPVAHAAGEALPGLIGKIESAKAPIIMVGNSMQKCGMDFRRLSKETGNQVMSLTSGGIWH